MNRKQLVLILVVFAVVGGLGLWLGSRRAASYKPSFGQMGQKVLGDFDVNAVARLVVRQGTNTLTLVKKDERWVVAERADYPANFSEVGETLRKFWNLKIVQPIAGSLGTSALERLELNLDGTNKTATLVELQDQDGKAIKSLVLGKQHKRQPATPSAFGGEEGWPDGRYVMVKAEPASASLVSETFSSIEPKPEQWLSKDFFKVEKVKSVAVNYPDAATNSWKLSRASETNEWVLAEAGPDEKLDTGKISGIPNALSWPSFTDVIVNPNLAELGLEKPITAELETFDGFHYAINAGKKSGQEDNYYMTVSVTGDVVQERTPGPDEKPEDKEKLDKEFKEKTEKLTEKLKHEKSLDGRVFQVSKWTLDSLLKKRHELLAEKKEEKKDTALGSTATNAPPVNPVDAVLPPTPPAPPTPDADSDTEE